MTRATPYSAFPKMFRQDVGPRQRLIGCLSPLGSPITTELLGLAGFDRLPLDSEHGPNDPLPLVPQLMARRDSPSAPVVRPHSNDGVVVKRLLDGGFFNVIFPCAQAAMARVFGRALACGKPAGILAPVEAEARRCMDTGATSAAVGSDLGVFRAGANGLRERFKQDGAREARA
jgi:2-dehydro-3-deoxyglucarate aldolase